MRIKGWMGRADQTAKIKGMFVRPEQVAEIVQRLQLVMKARVTVTREGERDAFEIAVEAPPVEGLAAQVAELARGVLKLSGKVRVVPIGGLPNDGKVIDDQRKYD
jgi:phenylacetate-CoA ligase